MNVTAFSVTITVSLTTLSLGMPVAAWAEQITFVSHGGSNQKAQTKAIFNPVAKRLGITINRISSPDAWPMIKAQIAAGKPTWDVVTMPTYDCIMGGELGLIERLDFSKIPNAASIPASYKSSYSVPYMFYSSVLAYNSKKYGDKGPKNWADFWNVKKFPGTRALRNHPLATLEAALLADGVKPDKLYPLDVDRAFKKLAEIRPYITVWWTTGAQSVQILADGKIDMEMAWNGRVAATAKNGAPVAFTYNQGLLQHNSLCILKGAPNAATAVKFLNAAIAPDIQANVPAYIDYGPGNPVAYKTGKISPKRAAQLPNAPANAAKQALVSNIWWGSLAGQATMKRWASFIQK